MNPLTPTPHYQVPSVALEISYWMQTSKQYLIENIFLKQCLAQAQAHLALPPAAIQPSSSESSSVSSESASIAESSLTDEMDDIEYHNPTTSTLLKSNRDLWDLGERPLQKHAFSGILLSMDTPAFKDDIQAIASMWLGCIENELPEDASSNQAWINREVRKLLEKVTAKMGKDTHGEVCEELASIYEHRYSNSRENRALLNSALYYVNRGLSLQPSPAIVERLQMVLNSSQTS